MLVSELITQLQALDPTLPVYTDTSTGPYVAVVLRIPPVAGAPSTYEYVIDPNG